MEDKSTIFIINSDNADEIGKKISQEYIVTDLNSLKEESDPSVSGLLFFEHDPKILEELPGLISVHSALIPIIFYKHNLDNKLLIDYFKRGVADCADIDDQIYVDEIIERYFDSGDEGKVVEYNNIVNKFKSIGIISSCYNMADIFSMVEKVSRSNSSVLITGESGTGKELIAKSIHHFSKRRNHNFVAVNTGAIPENLLEDELFGHVKGAFTSAIKDRKGRFEHADKGTIFLDEISNMPQLLQVKLLRVLQEREFEKVGDNVSVSVDVRVIAATNQNLEEMIRQGSFREDLYFRLNVIPIELPPLRKRKADIPLLANYFLKKYCVLNEFVPKSFTVPALRILKEFSWPGNIRQLENTVERMVVLNPDATLLTPSDIPSEIANKIQEPELDESELALIPEEGISLTEILKNIEKKYIIQSLEKTSWNKQKAAKLLNIKRTTLIEKIKKMQS